MQNSPTVEVSKVAIPRLERRPPDRASERRAQGKQEKRVSKACTNCRKRKVKCSGEQPTCSNCVAANLECVYDLARRDRLRSITHQKQSLVALLTDLRTRVNQDDQRAIDNALLHVEDDTVSQTSTLSSLSEIRRKQSSTTSADEWDSVPAGETRAPATIGSNEDLDLLDEDLLASKEARATGYVGKNSTVTWLRSLQKEVKQPDGQPYGLPYGPAGADQGFINKRSQALHERRRQGEADAMRPGTTATSFYLDAESLEPDVEVDVYGLPPFGLAEKLFNSYLRTVHPSYPITPDTLSTQFYNYYESVRVNNPFRVPDIWLAQLNLCFAIGSHYANVSDQAWKTDQKDHLIYMTRAVRLLNFNDSWCFSTAPDLPTIHVAGLLSFYYMAIGHVSRAWVTIGIAMRLALALGLHLRNEDPTLPASKKESLLRTWWSLHSIECLVSSLTGRPCVLESEDCTVEVPHVSADGKFSVPSQDSSHRGSNLARDDRHISSASPISGNSRVPVGKLEGPCSFLEARINIGVITQKILRSLYAPRVGNQPWSHIQATIPMLLTELEEWRVHSLPHSKEKNSDSSSSSSRSREILMLEFNYYNNVILITRPCLCRTERRIKDRSNASMIFNDTTARRCVQAAEDMADLFPDEPNPRHLFEKGPWWTLAHDIMQSLTVLLLELSYQSTHMPTEKAKIIPRTKKLIQWLRAMKVTDPSSQRAYKVVENTIRQSGNQFQAHIKDLVSEDQSKGDDMDSEQMSTPPPAFFSPGSHPPSSGPTDAGGISDPMEFFYGAQDVYKRAADTPTNAYTAASLLPSSKTLPPNINPTALDRDAQTFNRIPSQQHPQPQFYQQHPHPDYPPQPMELGEQNTSHFPTAQAGLDATTEPSLFLHPDAYSDPFTYMNPFLTSFDQVDFGGFMGYGGPGSSLLGNDAIGPTEEGYTAPGGEGGSMGGYAEGTSTGMGYGRARQF